MPVPRLARNSSMILSFQPDMSRSVPSEVRVLTTSNTILHCMSIPETHSCRGRKRDASIDARVLKVAGRHLAAFGFEGLSLAAVADEAGTTRQALYRRWPTKEH